MEELETVKRLTDDELVLRVRQCVREDRRVSAELLAHLGEIELRGLHRDLGYESMFEYAVRGLHMSDSEAGLRLHAARFARKFPDSLEMLSRGELHLTAMKLLAPVLTAENAELLKMSCLKTKQEIQLLIAKHCPQPDVPDAVRRLPTARPGSANATGLVDGALRPERERAATALRALDIRSAESTSIPAIDAAFAGVPAPLSPSDPLPATATGTGTAKAAAQMQLGHSQVDLRAGSNELPVLVSSASRASNREPALPISEGRYQIKFTAGKRVRDLLQEAQDLFRNQLPSGDVEVLVERALVLLVAERKKELYAQTDKPRRSSAPVTTSTASTSKPNSRHIPNATKRRVYARDKGQCRFVGPTGERCCARSRLEFHHIHAFGLGGRATEQNIVLFCRAHNALLAERDYSREHIQRCIRESQTARTLVSTAGPRAPSQPVPAQPTRADAPEAVHLSMPQYNPTRSGISEPRERDWGSTNRVQENRSEKARRTWSTNQSEPFRALNRSPRPRNTRALTLPKRFIRVCRSTIQHGLEFPNHASVIGASTNRVQENPSEKARRTWSTNAIGAVPRGQSQPSPAQPTRPDAAEAVRPSMPQYNLTRSGISEPRERDRGFNQPCARKPK
jgi:5-methylcytosine-specific restriction endonuclease McrA